jgi:hypothetical protein
MVILEGSLERALVIYGIYGANMLLMIAIWFVFAKSYDEKIFSFARRIYGHVF